MNNRKTSTCILGQMNKDIQIIDGYILVRRLFSVTVSKRSNYLTEFTS